MTPYLAQMMAFGGNFAIRGWATCSGQLMPIAQYQALFSLLGTTFGGDGRTTFALPDLRGRSVVGVGQGPGLSNISWGQKGGYYSVTLNVTNLPSHNHSAQTAVHMMALDNANEANETDSGNNAIGTGGSMPEIYREAGGTSDQLGGVSATTTLYNAGGNIPFNIRNPFLGIYYLIALQGIFPSRS